MSKSKLLPPISLQAEIASGWPVSDYVETESSQDACQVTGFTSSANLAGSLVYDESDCEFVFDGTGLSKSTFGRIEFLLFHSNGSKILYEQYVSVSY